MTVGVDGVAPIVGVSVIGAVAVIVGVSVWGAVTMLVDVLEGVFVAVIDSVGVGVWTRAMMMMAADRSAALSTPSAFASEPGHSDPSNRASSVATMSAVCRSPLQSASPGTVCPPTFCGNVRINMSTEIAMRRRL